MITLKKYTHEYYHKWNSFVNSSNNGTIFHRLDFLSYHGNKFSNSEDHLLWFKGDHLFAIMPMIVSEKEGRRIARSPYGGSYGGIVTHNKLDYRNSRRIVDLLLDYLEKNKIDEIIITPPTKILEADECDTLLFSFLESGFKFKNSDITSVVRLTNKEIESEVFTSRARNMSRKAKSYGVSVRFNQPVDEFWGLMDLTFSKHKAHPTHTFEEWNFLCSAFPQQIWNDIAYYEKKPVAGIGHIRLNDFTDSSFYLCSDPEYQHTQALSLLLYQSIIRSKHLGNKWFDFGTSSVNMIGRSNIFDFKESFGAIGVFRHTLSKC